MIIARRLRTRPDGVPVYGHEPRPGYPPVGRFALADVLDASSAATPVHAHAHDFFVVVYFERDGGAIRIGGRDWPVAAGDLYLVAPGDVVGIGPDIARLRAAGGSAVYFSPEALGASPTGSLLAWRANPLLFPFAQPAVSQPKRWTVPGVERDAWSARLRALDDEVHQPRHGHRDAVVAHLTLLLVDIARLARPTADRTRITAEPLIAEVLDYIDQHYSESISLRDVARAVNLSPGHLTTVVGRKTGRTVQAWITERRLAEARRLLVDTELSVDEILRRVGYRDPSYFARSFRKDHGTTPLGWRRLARTSLNCRSSMPGWRSPDDGQSHPTAVSPPEPDVARRG
jgi:AraC family transcriptional activator of pobA